MAASLWTATVRAIGVLTAALAVGVVVVSLQAARAQAGPPDPQTSQPAPLSEVLAKTQPMQLARAAPQMLPTPAPQAPRPAMRYPAPSDALPVTRARAVSGESGASRLPQSNPAPDRPLAAVLHIGVSVPPETAEVVLLAKQSLEAQGYDVSLAEGDAASQSVGPLRPDAYVSIQAVPGDSTAAGVEAWFCKVDGSLGGQLADLLLRSIVESNVPNVGQGDGEITNREAFSCDLLLAGRRRMPSVLLEIPTLVAGDSDGPALARGLAGGIDRFFHMYRRSLLQEDQRQRFVWPAVGPITSYFEPGHPLGIDIAQQDGQVVAAHDGIVLFADGNRCCSYGLYVVVESPDGITTVYAHLESVVVTAGHRVRQGQPLGIVGCTGRCFGTHLHFEVIDGGVRRNPLLYLP